jgi:pyruvate,orthophosphate dikinase
MNKFVYMFKEGNAGMRDLLGGKGANLAEMTNLGMPVPFGFTVTTEACNDYYEQGGKISDEIMEQIEAALHKLEEQSGKKFGDNENPLLVSVRSGARASMPGMMDTILNLGLNDMAVEGLAKRTDNPRFAYDSYRRFIQMFSDVVMELPKSSFERVLDEIKEKKNLESDVDLTAEDWKYVVGRFKEYYKEAKGVDFPQDPQEQLKEAVKAVFRSWDNPRAIVYRRLNDIPGDWGTAVNVQMMVFGNMGDTSGTGVAFTRNPATGEKMIYGEYLINAQGEDVVAGIRTPKPITTLEQDMPEVYKQFMDIAKTLENHYRDMQDMEFTIEDKKLFFLQTRNGKRAAAAALKVAVDMVDEGMITEEEAVLRVDPKQLEALLHPVFDAEALKEAEVIAQGIDASPGAAAGRIAFTAEDAKEMAKSGRVVLVRLETSPEDIEGMTVAKGILTGRGGKTSHAAVVARGMGTCCVAGCTAAKIDEDNKTLVVEKDGKRYEFHEGDYISLNGSTGEVYKGDIKTIPPSISGNFARFMGWADARRTMMVRTNADNPRDSQVAIDFGAEGIGLTRTEHMFFEEDRIMKFREMILADDVEARRKALDAILPYQKADFVGIYEVMGERPVNVRLLDPPLHEFLPAHDDVETINELAKDMGIDAQVIIHKIDELHEFNPMMGFRGCRLSVAYPEIAEMQTRAVMEAACQVKKEKGYNIVPEIMVPLIGSLKEFKFVKDVIKKVADQVIAESGIEMEYQIGTMIEIPRAALTADEVAKEAEYFSFGTNDLTQMTFGFSRDDAGKFLDKYYEAKIYESDPFARLDTEGVGQLVQMAADKGRKTRPNIKLGICGEHGGDPSSIAFCQKVGMKYVSCSPFRVPVARLAAAQAAIRQSKGE